MTTIHPTEPRHLQAAAKFLQSQTRARPKAALILGSGLGSFADELSPSVTIRAKDIPYFPESSVAGHEGSVVIGTISLRKKTSPPLIIFKGRTHFYETGSIAPVRFPVELAKLMGASNLIVTNAAGGINPSLNPGSLMLLRDYLSLTFFPFFDLEQYSRRRGIKSVKPHVLHNRRLSPSFPNRSAFDATLMRLFHTKARSLGISLKEGVYCWLKGPSYETAAEIKMFSRIGIDAVGMSTVPEIIAAQQLGMKVAAVSLISNWGTGITGKALSHNEVTETADRIKDMFSDLLKAVLVDLS